MGKEDIGHGKESARNPSCVLWRSLMWKSQQNIIPHSGTHSGCQPLELIKTLPSASSLMLTLKLLFFIRHSRERRTISTRSFLINRMCGRTVSTWFRSLLFSFLILSILSLGTNLFDYEIGRRNNMVNSADSITIINYNNSKWFLYGLSRQPLLLLCKIF